MSKKINNCFCFNDTNDNFIKWLLELLGPVVLGAKPSEILSFPDNVSNGESKINAIKNIFDNSNNILYKEFTYCNKCKKILFYNPNALDNTLKDHRNLKFLTKIGYPELYTLESYLDFIISKMKSGYIPDEIGVFLGYPLKDVIGFIGHPSLKLTKVNGWRVYGDSRLSDMKYMEFLDARQKMKLLLENNTPKSLISA